MASPKKAKDVHVNVTLNSEEPGDFTLEASPLGSPPTGPNGELVFENKGHPGFFIHFHLVDKTGLNYRFPRQNSIAEAVWSQCGQGACPKTGIWEIFNPRNVSGDRLTLIVENPNVAPKLGQFGYTLRVTKDDGQHYLDLDPGGDNRNGPISRFDWSSAMVGVTSGAVAGAAALMLVASASPSSSLMGALVGALVGLGVGFLVAMAGGSSL